MNNEKESKEKELFYEKSEIEGTKLFRIKKTTSERLFQIRSIKPQVKSQQDLKL